MGYATSQALLSEAESLYGALCRFQPAADAKMKAAMCSVSRDLGSRPSAPYVSKNVQNQVGTLNLDGESTELTTFWKNVLPARLLTLERMLEGHHTFTSSNDCWRVTALVGLASTEALCAGAHLRGCTMSTGVLRGP